MVGEQQMSKEARIVGNIKECPTKQLGKGEVGRKIMKVPLPFGHNYNSRDSGLSFLATARPTPLLSVVLQEFISISNLEISDNYKQISEILLY